MFENNNKNISKMTMVPPLSDSNMTQVAYQIRNVEKFHGDPGKRYTSESQIGYILAVYVTGDERQQQILFRHIECRISGGVGANNMTTWPQLRRQMVLNYKPQFLNPTFFWGVSEDPVPRQCTNK